MDALGGLLHGDGITLVDQSGGGPRVGQIRRGSVHRVLVFDLGARVPRLELAECPLDVSALALGSSEFTLLVGEERSARRSAPW